jgi:hypothetical protein
MEAPLVNEPARSAPVALADNQPWRDAWGDLRVIRVDAQDLWRTAKDFDQAAAITDAALRADQVQKAHAAFKQRYDHAAPDITARIVTVQGLLNQYPDLDDQMSDDVARIGNAWERVADAWSGVDPTRLDESLATMTDLRQQLSDMVYAVGMITIPSRLRDHLAQRDTGQTLNFHDTFGDELLDDDMEKRILRYLANVNTVPGEIDVEHGTILTTVATPGGIARVLAGIVLLAVLPFVLLAVNNVYPNVEDLIGIPEGRLPDLMKSYLLVLIGAAAHFTINLIKAQRAGQTLVIGQRLRWISARLGQIGLSIVSLWIVAYGAFRLLGPDFIAPTMFVVGYSWDSFFDLFLDRFTVAVNAANTGITGVITAPAG